MPQSLFDADFQRVYDGKLSGSKGAFPSPVDWRDCVIYFLMLDRFNNPSKQPVHQPFDDPQFSGYQGGTFSGVRDKLKYIKKLGAGAIWLQPRSEKSTIFNWLISWLRHTRFSACRAAVRRRPDQSR